VKWKSSTRKPDQTSLDAPRLGEAHAELPRGEPGGNTLGADIDLTPFERSFASRHERLLSGVRLGTHLEWTVPVSLCGELALYSLTYVPKTRGAIVFAIALGAGHGPREIDQLAAIARRELFGGAELHEVTRDDGAGSRSYLINTATVR
jgi:hypothetical protein